MDICKTPDEENTNRGVLFETLKTAKKIIPYFFIGCLFQYVSERHSHSKGPKRK